MRPIKLTMKAFGSYAEETSLDFESLTGGLYLIVGKTGAGKTTIFDAISFALFGVPSGSERTAAMLHSDYVSPSEDTVVTLDFRHQGRVWRVERRLHFQKKRAGGYDDAPKVSAEMTGADGSALEGAQRVTARCEELLGLTAEQFKRIVMLAQGEFREFLRSNSDKKNEILGKLFDDSAYLRYQNLLAAARDSLREQRSAERDEISAVMQTLFRLPEGAAAEDFIPDNAHLTENLRALVASDEAACVRLQAAYRARQDAVDALTRREAIAQADNEALAELDAQRERRAALEARGSEIAALRAEQAAAEKALHVVLPRAETLRRAEETQRRTESEIKAKEALLAAQRAALSAALREAEADESLRAEAEKHGAQTERLRALLPRYGDLAERRALLQQTEALLTRAEKDAAALETRQAALTAELESAQRELRELEGCEAEAVRLRGARDVSRDRLDAVAAPETGAAARVAAILLEAGALDALAGELRRLTGEAAAADETRSALYRAYLDGQAGTLASELERALDEHGEARCPVCGARWHSGEAHAFALPAGHVPTQDEVEAAEAAAKEKEQARQTLYTETEKRRSLLAQRRSAAADDVGRLDPALGTWGALTAPGALEALAQRLRAALETAETALAAAQTRCARREALLRTEKDKTGEREALLRQRDDLRVRREQLSREAHGLHAAIDELTRQLPFPDRQTAQAQLDQSAARRAAILETVAAHEQSLSAAKAACDAASGALHALRGALPRQDQARAEAEEALARALAETGFAALADAEAALAPAGGDGEAWLAARRQTLEDYARELASARERVAALETQTAGKTRTDADALRAALEAARAEADAAAEAVSAQSAALAGHRAVCGRVAAAAEALRDSERAWRRIDRLAELAVGVSGEGGRLSFDRYVMGAIFREVLEMANRRLDVMTGGRFELVHSLDASRRNAAAGLEIEVLDVALNKRRPSASISGGEGFLVSLALALGLSDVVQSHAGGQRLDTLFIDEGFGSLDDGRLDDVISVLQQLTEGDRLVGIISHVDKLEESIPQKLRVTSGERGSTLKMELS